MKKVLLGMLALGSLVLSSCAADKLNAKDTQSKLEKNSYSVTTYSGSSVKEVISGIKFYDDLKMTGAIYAEKGKDDNKDFLLAFFFDSIGDADKFSSNDNYENTVALSRYGEQNLGSNLKLMVGTHNNVCYAGSETSVNIAFSIVSSL